MNYLKIFLRDKKELKKELKEHPERLEFYSKFETLIGPTDSVNYLRKKLTKL